MHHPTIERFLASYPWMQKLPTHFILFIVFGGIATVVDWSIFYATHVTLHWHYLISVTLSSLGGSLTSFSANRYWNFRNFAKRFLPHYGVFATVTISALVITYILMALLIDVLHVRAMHARIGTTALVMFYNYFAQRRITFKQSQPPL